jgi:hypothetical protein
MDSVTRSQLIERYRAGHREVVDALDGAGHAELDRRPAPDCWTAREIVHHLADSETTSYLRLRKLLAEDAPIIVAYDENLYARRLRYDRPIATSLAVFDLVRRSSAELLDTIDEADWQRSGNHSESGPYSMHTWLTVYAAHAHDHADQIRRARRGER